MTLYNVIPDMTSNTAPSGVASASNAPYSWNAPWNAMDRNIDTIWRTNTAIAWVQYKIQTADVCSAYTMTAYRTDISFAPNTFSLLASNTGAFGGEEVTLDTRTGITWVSYEKKTFTFTNTTPYLYYRIKIDSVNGATYIMIAEIELLAVIPNVASITVSLSASAQMQINASALSTSISVTANNRVINKSAITASALATADAQRATNGYSFIFVGEIQRSNTIQTFNFVQAIEQLPTSTIITRVNV